MFPFLAPFLAPVPLTLAVYFQESTYSSTLERFAWFGAVTAASTPSIFNPQWENLFLRYFISLYSCWFIIWSANILFISQPSEYRRIQKRSPAVGPYYLDNYFWQPLPKEDTWARFFWALDLATNFRGIGWSHGMNRGSLPPELACHLEKKDVDTIDRPHSNRPEGGSEGDHRLCFLKTQIWRLLRAYFWLDSRQKIIIPFCSTSFVQGGQITGWGLLIQHIQAVPAVVKTTEVVGSVMGTYSCLDGVHALVSLVGVLLCCNETWMYPSLFGSTKTLSSLKIQDAFGKFWQNHFKHGLTSVSRRVVPRSPHPALTNLLRAFAIFSLIATIHGAGTYAVIQNAESLVPVFFFDCMQPVCIVFQMIVSGAVSKHISPVLGRVVEFAIGSTWFYWILPLRSGDEAVCQALESVRVPWSMWEVIFRLSEINMSST